jgi:hypothetical protein
MPERPFVQITNEPPQSTAAIDCRVEVQFNERSSYKGMITKYDSSKGWFVEYDDGDKEWENGQRNVHLLSSPDRLSPDEHLEISQSGASGYSMSFEEADFEDANEGQQQQPWKNYMVETQIEANYKQQGKWLGGKIKKAHSNGMYDIEYSDGWRYERGVMEDNVRLLDGLSLSVSLGSQPAFAIGAVIEARYGGKQAWYKGKIKCSYPGREVYDVGYDDGDMEAMVASTLIRVFTELAPKKVDKLAEKLARLEKEKNEAGSTGQEEAQEERQAEGQAEGQDTQQHTHGGGGGGARTHNNMSEGTGSENTAFGGAKEARGGTASAGTAGALRIQVPMPSLPSMPTQEDFDLSASAGTEHTPIHRTTYSAEYSV